MIVNATPHVAARVPHETEAMAWCATAWPIHPDWDEVRDAAQAQVADLARAMTGQTPPAATVHSRYQTANDHRAQTPPRPGQKAAQDGAASSALLAPSPAERLALGLPPLPSDNVQNSPATSARPPASDERHSPSTDAAGSQHTSQIPSPRPVVQMLVPAPPTSRPDPTALPNVNCTPVDYGDVWLRDTGPVFVQTQTGWKAVAFRFNGWGGRFYSEADSRMAETLAKTAGMGVDRLDMVGEPGTLEFDGQGTLITSRRCLLNTNRNPNLSQTDAEAILSTGFGAERTLWLEECLAGDHTDGHSDTLARFVRPGLVVTEAPFGPADPNAQTRDNVARRLDGARDAQGRAIDVVRVPGAHMTPHRERGPLPATHMNFVIAGERVIIPLYGSTDDLAQVAHTQTVLNAFGDIFPDHEIIGLPCNAIMAAGGGFHSLTTHAPRGVAMTGKHTDRKPAP